MLSFTKQERMVVFIFVTIVSTGSCLNILFKKYPVLRNSVNLIESDRLYLKLDVNAASLEELVAVPFIGEYTARNIIEFRTRNGKFKSLSDLKNVKGVRDKNYAKFVPHLKIKGE